MLIRHNPPRRCIGQDFPRLDDTLTFFACQGNDAAYTLQAMLGISFKALDVSRERRAAIAAARAIRIEDAAKDAQQHVQDDFDEWDMVDVEDQGAAASAAVDSEPGKSTDPVVGSAEVGAKQKAEEKVNGIKIEETEVERIALAAGDDIGDDGASQTIVEKGVSDAEDIPVTHNNDIGTTDGPVSDRNSLISSMNVGESDSRALSDNGEDASLSSLESSPLAAEVAARLKFLDDEDSDEEGGVKL